jgi:uracil phosphoribosyltransferase
MLVSNHPLARHLLGRLRDTTTEPHEFRQLAQRLTTILALEATIDLPMIETKITTPLEQITGETLQSSLVVVPILRAGLGMVEPFFALFPEVSVGYIGLERDHTTALASSYYCKLPDLTNKVVLIVDPMLATGGSAVQAIDAVKQAGGTNIRLLCIIAAPEGVASVESAHPDVPIYGAAIDRELSPLRYILPGLGDFGDRLYGTM